MLCLYQGEYGWRLYCNTSRLLNNQFTQNFFVIELLTFYFISVKESLFQTNIIVCAKTEISSLSEYLISGARSCRNYFLRIKIILKKFPNKLR